MVSQLLFGETYTILQKEGDWFLIKMDYDGYEGWLSDSSICEYSERNTNVQTQLFLSQINDIRGGEVLTSMGSEIGIAGVETKLFIGKLALQFLGAPYLWGGRHFRGIDCSGFVQVLYKCLKVKLPRDAAQQQKIGKPVAFENLFEGDLVFFLKNERVGHVGIALGSGKIVHSHGMVRVDDLTKEGIFNSDTGAQSHIFHSAKRLR